MLQGSLMIDSTGFRTGGNENTASIINAQEGRTRHAELNNALSPERPNLRLKDLSLYRQDAQKGRPARPQRATQDDPSKLARYLLSRGGLAWSPTAHVERPLLHRGGSVSTGDQPGHPAPFFSSLLKDFSILT